MFAVRNFEAIYDNLNICAKHTEWNYVQNQISNKILHYHTQIPPS
jgi:hypothetical protein